MRKHDLAARRSSLFFSFTHLKIYI